MQMSAEEVAAAYIARNGGQAWAALVELAGDALSDLSEAKRQVSRAELMVSAGYVRRTPPQARM
jgi:photosystem II stability/assembly factor-like uncharacterized protein